MSVLKEEQTPHLEAEESFQSVPSRQTTALSSVLFTSALNYSAQFSRAPVSWRK